MNSGPDVIADAAEVLKLISEKGIPVMQGWYDKNMNDCHVTLWDLGELEENFSDDDAEHVRLSIQITIFSKSDEIKLVRKIKKLMKDNGFDYEGRNADNGEPENGIYLKAQRFSKLYESEENGNE